MNNKISVVRKPLVHPELGVKIGEQVTTTYKICTDNCISKQQLISFLKDKIKTYKSMIVGSLYSDTSRTHYEAKIIAYEEVIDFIVNAQ